ncbi:MAG: efflux RND transporter periplasmic adaptor subunit [Proteobacteria bacterium]|nr:efflux RND transporter periplasmic adaptor subunit [Pseudomonadota bacterium]
MKKRVVIVVFVVLLVGVGLLVYLGQQKVQRRELYYSGTIEATQAELSFQVSGRVVSVPADEGQMVEEGQLLAELDRSEYLARHKQARANLDGSVKRLRQLEVVLEIYRKTLPAEVVRAKAAVSSSRDIMEEAQKHKERYDKLFEKNVVSEREWETVNLEYQTAKAKLSEEKAVLNQARSNLKKIEATERELEATKARIQAAKAVLELAEIQLKYTQLRAPFGGIITSRNVESGEVVMPGREVLTLSDLSIVDLKIFVDETEIGKVKPGQRARVKVDTFPDKVYKGKVSFISSEGEFTPKIIQTHKERVKLVYLVKVSIPNPDLELKPGMPADAWLR